MSRPQVVMPEGGRCRAVTASLVCDLASDTSWLLRGGATRGLP